MPTYQYRCTECTNELEVVQKFTDDALTECPECEGRLRKVFNAVGVVFKGSGFYATDNRSKGRANAARAESATSGSGSTTGESASGDRKHGDHKHADSKHADSKHAESKHKAKQPGATASTPAA